MVDRTLPLDILQSSGATQAAPVKRTAPGNAGRTNASILKPPVGVSPSTLPSLNGGAAVYAYVANSDTNTVSVIDMSNFTKVKDIVVGTSPTTGPVALDADPENKYLYVVNRNGTMTIVNVSDYSIANTINLPVSPASSPTGVKVSYNGKYVYVVYNATPIVSIINAASQQAAGSISLPDSGFGIDITGDGRYAYVTLRNSDQVAVVDLLANLVIKLICDVPSPENITMWFSGSLAFVSGTRANEVSVLNTNLAEAAPETIPADRRPAGIAVNETSRRVYAALAGSRQVEVIDTQSGTILSPIDVGQIRPEDVDITYDGNFLVVANSVSGTASLVNLTTNQVQSSIPTGAGASFVLIVIPPR